MVVKHIHSIQRGIPHQIDPAEIVGPFTNYEIDSLWAESEPCKKLMVIFEDNNKYPEKQENSNYKENYLNPSLSCNENTNIWSSFFFFSKELAR